MPAKGSTPSSRNASPTGAGARRHAPADMPTAQSRPRGVALDAAVADSGALRAALGETGSWRAQAEALARMLVEGTRASGAPLLDVQRAFAIFPPGSPAGESLFRLAEALPRIPDRPSRSEEHASELQSPCNLVCRLLLEKKKNTPNIIMRTAYTGPVLAHH